MTEIYKIFNGVAPPIINSLFEFRSNEYNIINFQLLSTDFRRTVNYGTEILRNIYKNMWHMSLQITQKIPTKFWIY